MCLFISHDVPSRPGTRNNLCRVPPLLPLIMPLPTHMDTYGDTHTKNIRHITIKYMASGAVLGSIGSLTDQRESKATDIAARS